MDLARKRRIDLYLGTALLTITWMAARLLGAALRRNHSSDPTRAVVICKFQGMGSLAIARSSILQLRAAHPGAQLIFWGTPATSALAKLMPEVDQVLELRDDSIWAALRSLRLNLGALWSAKIDWAFDLEVYSRLSSVLLTLTCARNRAGFAVDTVKMRRNCHTHLVLFNRYGFLGDAYERLLGLCLPAGSASKKAEIAFRSEPLKQAPKQADASYIVVNIHCGPLAYERRWPLPFFDRLLEKLLRELDRSGDHDTEIILIGNGPEELAYAGGLAPRARIRDLTSRLSLSELIAVLAGAKLVITGDTAPLHLALGTSVPVVALFGPTRSESYLPPNREKLRAIQYPIYCSPCVHHWEPLPCGGDNQCMKRIPISQVLGAALDLLGLPAAEEPDPPPPDPASTRYYPGLIFDRLTD